MGVLLGQKYNGLSDAPAGVTVERLREYVITLKQQEGGRLPDKHKINGNMAWHERAKAPTTPLNQYFDSLGRDGSRVLADLKNRVPEVFGLPSNTSVDSGDTGNTNDESQNSGNDSESKDASTGNNNSSNSNDPVTAKPDSLSVFEKVDPKVWYGLGGGLGLIVLISILKN